jgi:iron-sulfur cluster insertion protein
MVTMTARAVDKVKEIAASDETIKELWLRVTVKGGGCAGFTHDLCFEEKVGEMDEEFDCSGVKVYIDPLSFQYLENTEIDYVQEAHAEGFKFNNPNVKGSCGCGSSVSF